MSRRASVADLLSAPPARAGDRLALDDGSRVAVIGGGPAGSFFSNFLLELAETIDLEIEVDIYEPRSFDQCGPGGCNHCGGIVSESLVQVLAAEGINLPETVVQRGIDSYVVHMDVGSVRIASPVGEERIAALYRGNGPRGAVDMPWESFDRYLLELAEERGARVVRRLVDGIEWGGDLPTLRHPGESGESYDLVVVATGVNSNFLGHLQGGDHAPVIPERTKTFICELASDRATIQRVLGSSMHVFLLDIPRLEFAALIPKGDYVTMCLLGDDVDDELVQSFVEAPEVKACLPPGGLPRVCNCSPYINVDGAARPFADRLVMIGDCGVTRLYKDGIGAAYRTAKAAAKTAAYQGISAEAFARHYLPTCRSITGDNAIGKLIFSLTTVFKRLRFTRRAIFTMTSDEQRRPGRRPHMSGMLWNLFTGSAPYKEILAGTLHPGFVGGLVWNLARALRPGGKPVAAEEREDARRDAA